MTVTEFNNEFDIHYNAIASNSAPGLDPYEKSVFLTKAQLEIVKGYYNPLGNKYKKGFENSEKRRTDLKELVINHNSTTTVTSSSGLSSDSKFFIIPDDVFLIIYETASVTTDDCFVDKQVTVVPKTHDEYNIQIDNPFKQPHKNKIWRLNISKLSNGKAYFKVVELISPYTITKYQFRYIKHPAPIILADLAATFPGEGLSIDGITTPQTCALDESIHREILDRAVELALRDYKPANLESKIQLDQRNE
jgi:hypothetical protein